MSFRSKKNLHIAIVITLLLIVTMGYRVFFGDKEYVLQENAENRYQDSPLEETKEESSVLSESEIVFSENISSEVTVYVSGAVLESKVVTLKRGKRLIDAVEACGGLTKEADVNRVNLSLKLEEEHHYVIPKIGEDVPDDVQSPLSERFSTSNSGKINLNTASVEQLKTLPGVGDVLAQRIVDKRTQSGPFQSVEDLLAVSGIGEKKFDDIKNLVSVQ